ncbi:hypothetical protein ASPWEDRAFT_49718 [Aspergillus wentii DTO 134E9]|uniref:Farnesyl pyrophosphate synthase n=1 Tax=Aspergillus wentii DTO 134E9 TaxID=1073089 RepID=A0A1L9RY17_ASPWE|nr:uncharacterized protein ASPWEDRAFT_49718 [Aspergillus wentii DTO 134E9]OJJ39850.1 hypothetical protein ASPWEDRAFT_49718 [Aspergillus wentii DTO 134E9]
MLFAEILSSHINVPSGKLFCGLDRPLTVEEFYHLSVLGWLVEMLQVYVLFLDDIMDGSTTCRGQPCWYLRPEVGMNAINEACLLKSAIFILFKKHFGTYPSYLSMLESFQEIAFLSETGQECLASETNVQQTKDIIVPLGQFYQVQNDFLGVFGATARTGKIGTDIQKNKCSWLVIKALCICDDRQRQITCNKYGQVEGEDAVEVEELFRSLKEKTENLDESER